jgi:cytochrome c oxidase subunit 2
MTPTRLARVPLVVTAAATLALPLALAACGGDDGSGSDGGVGQLTGAAGRGQRLAQEKGCVSCHSNDGSSGTGPTWRGIWGTTVELEGGGTATVDRAYVARSIREPQAQVVEGFTVSMPTFDLSDQEIDDIVAYLQALGPGGR